MGKFFNRNLTSIVILLSIFLGFALPEAGMIWKPYLSYFLMTLMFLVTLALEPKEITQTAKNYRVVAIGLFCVFVLTPLLSLIGKPFLSTTAFAEIVLAFSAPSAIATAFWVKVFKGEAATGLVLSIVTNLLSIITIPATMLIAIGTTVSIDATWMMINLAELILIPMTASFLIKKTVKINIEKVANLSSRIELVILVLLIWGSIAPAAAYAEKNMAEFAQLNIIMLVALALAFAIAYYLAKGLGHKQAVSIAVASSVKNAVLSLVIGSAMFGPAVLSPLIANLIAQNLLLVPVKIMLKDK
jgi:predicted Na+-dependent transporter